MNLSNTVKTQSPQRTRRETLQQRVCCACSTFAFFVLFVANPSGKSDQRLPTGSRSLLLSALVLVFALAVAGCGNRAQQQAYERAVQAEQHLTVETAPALIADYRRVIALEPNTAWARQAGERIAAVEARVKAEELHKAVFQEHGVD